MTLPPLIWVLALLGAWWLRPQVAMQRLTAGASAVLLLTAGLAQLAWLSFQSVPQPSEIAGLLLTVLAALTYWLTQRGEGTRAEWGGWLWGLAGAVLACSSHDWLMIGVGLELVRMGTRRAVDAHAPSPFDRGWSAVYWLAVSLGLLWSGSTDGTVWHELCEGTYLPTATTYAYGRPALIVRITFALVLIALWGPCLTPCGTGPAAPAARFLRVAIATTVLARWLEPGSAGLDGVLWPVGLILLGLTWLGAWQTLGPTERWSAITESAVRWQSGWMLLTTLLLMAAPPTAIPIRGALVTPLDVSFGWSLELLQGGLGLTALLAVAGRAGRWGDERDFLAACRGCGTSARWTSVALTLPWFALLGLPGTLGCWSRLLTLAGASTLHQIDAGDLARPHGGALFAAAMSVLATALAFRGGWPLLRTIWWEAPLASPRPPHDRTSLMFSLIMIAFLLLGGLAPGWVVAGWAWIDF